MARRTSPLLSEALDRYLTVNAVRLSKAALVSDKGYIGRLIRSVGDKPCHTVTVAVAEDYAAMELAKLAPSSYNQALSRLRQFTRWCAKRGWLDGDPFGELGLRRVPRTDRMRLSADEIRRLLEASVDPRDRALVAVAANSGLRSSSIKLLTVGDVDLQEGTLSYFAPKTQTADTIPLTADLDRELRRWLTHYAQELKRPLTRDDLLLPARTAPQPHRVGEEWVAAYGRLRPSEPWQTPHYAVQRALAALGLPTHNQGCHTLRRSVARIVFERASEAGHDAALRTTAALLGHSSITTTESYIGVTADKRKRDELLRGASLYGLPENVVQLRRQA